jgi:hypothetical protein
MEISLHSRSQGIEARLKNGKEFKAQAPEAETPMLPPRILSFFQTNHNPNR